MKKIIILTVPVLFSLSVAAQNLNPEVHVTNEYQTRLDDVSKQGPELTVPDSLLRFDYHFDYSVFDSPYKGSYDFSPYSVTITPDPKPYDGRKLYVSAGAGYNLRPEFDAVWAAVDRKRFALNVFGSAKGFVGKYYRVTNTKFDKIKNTQYPGYDFRTAAGIDARFSLGHVGFFAEAGYDGVYTRHEIFHTDNCHAPYGELRFGYDSKELFATKGGVKYRFVHDWLNGTGTTLDHEFQADVTLSFRPAAEYRVNTDLTFVTNNFYNAGNIHPHLIFQLGIFDIDAGFRIGWVPGKFSANPDITAAVHLFNDYLKVYAGAVGQDHYLTYWDYKNLTHHYFLNYTANFLNAVDTGPRPVREIADLYLGVDGHADFGFQYDVKAGYRFLQDAPFWAADERGFECLAYQDLGMFHADIALGWASERFNLDASARLVKIPDGVPDRVFEPSLISGTLKGTYNWLKRIYAGISMDMATPSAAVIDGATRIIPGYFNLGVMGEYRMNKRLSFWLKGYNLLNHEIRISPIYSEVGPAVTIGATFSI